jgi:SAM-dependent methyltransferase
VLLKIKNNIGLNMAHYQQLKFIEILGDFFPNFFIKKKILEIGSWDVSGSIRQFFTNCEYVGVDVSEGPGVDIVSLGQDLKLPDKYFDLVISCECFEHNPNWIETFDNMYRMLNDDGLFVLTCATYGRREHGTPRRSMSSSLTSSVEGGEYYLNLADHDISSVFPLHELFSSYKFYYNTYGRDLYFIGFKSKNFNEDKLMMKNLSSKVNLIRKPGKVGLFSDFIKKIKFRILFVITNVFGDKKYQDLRYALSSKNK